jgi:hypothetical protein
MSGRASLYRVCRRFTRGLVGLAESRACPACCYRSRRICSSKIIRAVRPPEYREPSVLGPVFAGNTSLGTKGWDDSDDLDDTEHSGGKPAWMG